jgi:peroxiredoxin
MINHVPKYVNFVNRVGDEAPMPGMCAIGGEFETVATQDIFANKNVIIFALPGAFTPTCSSQQLPGYERLYNEFKKQGVDEVYCISVNDGFVMNAWKKELGLENVKMLSDGNGQFTDQMGMLVKKTNLGFGYRSWRYSAYVENGAIVKMFEERGKQDNCPDDPYEVSGPENMLNFLENR